MRTSTQRHIDPPACGCTPDAICQGSSRFLLDACEVARESAQRGDIEGAKRIEDAAWQVFNEHRDEALTASEGQRQ